MFPRSKRFRLFFAGCALLSTLLAGTVSATVPAADSQMQLLKQADSLKTSNHAEFIALLQRLSDGEKNLSPQERLYLGYLNAWQFAYRGEYAAAIPLLDTVISQSTDATLRFRANLTAVNILSNGNHYEEAFARLRQLLDQLPQITEKDARIQTLGIAAQLYIGAEQYDLGTSYADQILKEDPSDASVCKGMTLKIHALYGSGKMTDADKEFRDSADVCVRANEPIFASAIYSYVASAEVRQGQFDAAIDLLDKNYAALERTHYQPLIAQFNALLAQAYWGKGDITSAEKFATDALANSIKGGYTEALTIAYDQLYLVAKKQGDMVSALAYHEKYMAADKGYLTVISAKALAYQVVSQQVLAKKLQIDTLSKQNQILMLQKELSRKAAEASRLYIILLLIALASIGMWTYRIKRSQLRFMKLARRDGLTGIFNRQHFVSEAELQLQYCRKSSRDACLVLIDLDHFKAVNDNHGHAVGDRVLKRAVETCQTHLRSTDIFGRLGGEEFGILLPECTLEQALGRAEQIRKAIAMAAPGDEAPGVPVSASFGIASVTHSGYELRQLLIHADEALYQAKREGRNRVSVSVSDTQEACAQTG
ncbi:GGDEF domain-containing protein [Rhodanobacter sp. B04]|uniref:tetratricopeptide repeat-containing diguanylate cyclase n=1 Tax=Rhodanobacter sp. B04 TaxID=1945860 RepID=UPI0009D4EFB2|nr:GGDEF domain-containing protein [Rhodanobacter sp. B04]OOG64729.1 GGDEF domain-containing protein [Rhodanobacter sp. B04]